MFTRGAARAVLIVAALVFAGWLFHVRDLTSFFPDYPTMKVNTALCLCALALSLIARSVQTALLTSGIVLILTTTSAISSATGYSLGLDQVLDSARGWEPGTGPGHADPAAVLALFALAGSRGLLALGLTRRAQALLAVPFVIGNLAMVGYLFDLELLHRNGPSSTIAAPTAAAVLLLTLAMAALVPGGLMPWAASGTGPGAAVVRETVPMLAGGALVLGIARKVVSDLGVLGGAIGDTVLIMLGTLVAVGAVIHVALRLHGADRARVAAEESLLALNLSLVQGRDRAQGRAADLRQRLTDSQVRFETATSGTDDSLWTVETTEGSLEVVDVSPETTTLAGVDLRQGQSILDAIVEHLVAEDLPAFEEFRGRVLAGSAAEVELRFDAGERQEWHWLRGAPRHEGERTFYDGLSTNITERKRLSEEREHLLVQERLQVQRLLELNRIRDEFVAVAGHELRTPVAVILGYCELLAEDPTDPTHQVERIAIIQRRANQLNDLVHRVFDLATVDSGELELVLEPVAIADVVQEVLDDHWPAAFEAGIALTVAGASGTVFADRPRLRQVFDNLVTNAIKFTPNGGRVSITVTETADSTVFEVSDDGIGVPEDEFPLLFDRLFRASTARSAGIPGTGLGLPVCKALVEAHGGTIAARPNHPHGTVFTVSLPTVPNLRGTSASAPAGFSERQRSDADA